MVADVLEEYVGYPVSLLSVEGEEEGLGETGEMIEPIYSQDTFENESAIMLKDVPGIEILAKAVLIENGLIEDKTGNDSKYYFDDVAMIVNSKEMLKDVVVPSNTSGEEDVHYKWPEIDFEKYSLVIGHFFTGYYALNGFSFTQQYIVKGSSKNVLYLELDIPVCLFCAISNNFFATLYPKLPDGKLEVKVLNKEEL